MSNENDDWEVAVDTGQFDKQLEQQEKDRAATQESTPFNVIEDDQRNSSSMNLIQSNKPIRILKRPTSQSQLPVSNDPINPSQISTIVSIDPFFNDNSTSTIESSISIIPRNQTKDSIQTIASSSTKPTIKTYEQREQEYRLARLRIMGEEESSVKDDDDHPTIDLISPPLNETVLPSIFPTNAIHFTTNGPFSQQQFHPVYSSPSMPLPRYPPTGLFNYSANSWYSYTQEPPQQYGPPQ